MGIHDAHREGRLAWLCHKVPDLSGQAQRSRPKAGLDAPIDGVVVNVDGPVDGDGVALVGLEYRGRDDLELGAVAARLRAQQEGGVGAELDGGPHRIGPHGAAEAEDDIAVGGDRRRVVGRIDRHQGRPPLSDEPPGVLEAILLPGGIGVAGVHRNLVGSGNVEVDVGVDERQRVATPGEVTVLRSTAAGQGGAEPEPLLHRFVVHRPVEVDGDRLVGRHIGRFTARRDADDARRVERAGAHQRRQQCQDYEDCAAHARLEG